MEQVKLSQSGWKRFVGIIVAITLIPVLACACSSGQNQVESKQETAIPEMPQSNEQQGDADTPQGEILPLDNLEAFHKARFIEAKGPALPTWDSIDDVRAAYLAVMNEDTCFLNVDDNKCLTITERLDRLRTPAEILEFAVVDLDKDNIPEVVLRISVAGNDCWESIILHYQEHKIYGYTEPYRGFHDLKFDGTFSYTEGLMYSSGFSTMTFVENQLQKNNFLYYKYSNDNDYVYYIDCKPGTVDEYLIAEEMQREKSNVIWYEYTEKNIKTVFQ